MDRDADEFWPIEFRRAGGLLLAHIGPIELGCVGPNVNGRRPAFWRSYLPGFVGASVKHAEPIEAAQRALVKSVRHWFEACGRPLTSPGGDECQQ